MDTAVHTREALFCVHWHGADHYIFLAAFNIFLSFAASLGNVLILIALQKESSLHSPSKLMFCCLAITDLCVGLTTQPMFAAELIFQVNNLQHVCRYFRMGGHIAGVVFSGVSLMTVTAISVDRLLALSLDLRYGHVVTRRRVGAILSCFWLACIAVSLLQRILNYNVFSKIISATIILCLLTSVFCYTTIFIRLRHRQVQIRDQVHQGQQNEGGIPLNIARYRKTVSVALWVQITLVACYLPSALLMSFESLFSLSEVSFIFGIRYTITLVFLNSSLNPFLYCWKIREVRQRMKEIFTRFFNYMSC